MAETKQAAAGGATTVEADSASLLDQILDQTKPADTTERQRNKQFIEEVVRQALAAKPGSVVAGDVERTIKLWQAEIDKKLSAQLNEVMHHPEFQKLEGTWRGLDYLVKQSETGERLRIKVLNVTKKELAKDLEKAVEFDQSRLFKIVYEHEYGQLGGHPFGMLSATTSSASTRRTSSSYGRWPASARPVTPRSSPPPGPTCSAWTATPS